MLIGVFGVYLEIINAFDYIQGARNGYLYQFCRSECILSVIMTLRPDKRLTLITSDPRISTALVLLSVSRMLLIYLNYRFWIRMWKDTYAKFLGGGLLDRNRNTRNYVLTSANMFRSVSLQRNLDEFDIYRLFLFL